MSQNTAIAGPGQLPIHVAISSGIFVLYGTRRGNNHYDRRGQPLYYAHRSQMATLDLHRFSPLVSTGFLTDHDAAWSEGMEIESLSASQICIKVSSATVPVSLENQSVLLHFGTVGRARTKQSWLVAPTTVAYARHVEIPVGGSDCHVGDHNLS